jgi:hypothetical protein
LPGAPRANLAQLAAGLAKARPFHGALRTKCFAKKEKLDWFSSEVFPAMAAQQSSFQGSVPLALLLLLMGNAFIAIFLASFFGSRIGWLALEDVSKLSTGLVIFIGLLAVAIALLQLFSRIIRLRSLWFKAVAAATIVFLGVFLVQSFDAHATFNSGFSQEFLAITSTIAWLVAKATRIEALHMLHYLVSTVFVMSLAVEVVNMVEALDPLHFLEFELAQQLDLVNSTAAGGFVSESPALHHAALYSLSTARAMLLFLWNSLGLSFDLLRLAVQVLVLAVVSFGYALSPPGSHHHITSPLRLFFSCFIISISIAELSPVVPIMALRQVVLMLVSASAHPFVPSFLYAFVPSLLRPSPSHLLSSSLSPPLIAPLR